MSKSLHERWKEDAKDYEKRAAEDKDMKERVEKKKEHLKATLGKNKKQ